MLMAIDVLMARYHGYRNQPKAFRINPLNLPLQKILIKTRRLPKIQNISITSAVLSYPTLAKRKCHGFVYPRIYQAVDNGIITGCVISSAAGFGAAPNTCIHYPIIFSYLTISPWRPSRKLHYASSRNQADHPGRIRSMKKYKTKCSAQRRKAVKH
eukprot:6196410-Pleurochrysis_carterae.AAC.5